MTVYIDVLFAINGIVNYFLLLATSKITKQQTSLLKLILGSFIGAVYAVCMFFPQIKSLYTIISKIIVSFLLIAVTFNIKRFTSIFKTVLVFYTTSFIFGGIALGLFYFLNFGKGTVISNGVFYFSLPWRILICSSVISYALIRFFYKTAKSGKFRDYKRIDVFLMGKKISLNALIDTGNMLSDPVSDTPVIIAEYEIISPLLSNDFKVLYENNRHSPENIILNNLDENFASRLRIIPFSSLGTEKGFLLGIKPDSIRINKILLDNIIIGIYGSRLSESKDYDALLNPEIISAL